MSKGAVFNGQITYKPGVYVENIFQTLVGRPAGSGTLAVVGDFPFLEGKQAYYAQSLTQLRAIAPMAEELLRVAGIIYSCADDPDVRGVPAGVYLISPTDTTQPTVNIESSIQVDSKIWGSLGNLTTIEVTPDAITGGYTVVVANSGFTEEIRVPNADGVLTLAYTVPTPDDDDIRVVTTVTPGTDVFETAEAHGFVVDDEVEIWVGTGGVLPTDAGGHLVADNTVYVKSTPTATTFTLSDTDSGGANVTIDVTAAGTLPIYFKKVSDRLTAKGFDSVTAVTNAGGIDVAFTKSIDDDNVGVDNTHNAWEPTAPIAGTLTVTPSAAATVGAGETLTVRVVGKNHLGVSTTVTRTWTEANVADAVAKTINVSDSDGADPVDWSEVTSVQVWSSGGLDDFSGQLAFTGKCFKTFNAANGATYVANVIKAVNRWTASGFLASTTSGRTGSIAVASLDIISTPDTLPATFDATIAAIVETVNAQSALVEMTVLEYTALTITEATTYLTSGGSATAGTSADWDDCYTELEGFDIDGVCPLTTDATIHAGALAHCKYMQGNGRNDRQAFLGAASLESYAALAARVVALQTGAADVLNMFCDDTYIIGPSAAAEWLGPQYTALQAAAIAVGNLRSSLTRKRPRVLAHRRNAALSNEDSKSDLIRAGYTILETLAGGVPRYLRWVTAWLETDNDILTDGAAVRSRMIMNKALRAGLDPLIGTLGTTATQALIESRVIEIMDQLARNEEITRWDVDTLDVAQSGNTWVVGLEAQPAATVLFINPKVTLSVPTS